MDLRMLIPILAFALAACGSDVVDRVAGTTGQAVDNAAGAVKDAGRSVRNAAGEAKLVANDAQRTISDAAITASIKADLLKDPELSAIKIEVDTRDGMVTLNGLAPTRAGADRAGRIAGAIAGVTEVRNYVVSRRG